VTYQVDKWGSLVELLDIKTARASVIEKGGNMMGVKTPSGSLLGKKKRKLHCLIGPQNLTTAINMNKGGGTIKERGNTFCQSKNRGPAASLNLSTDSIFKNRALKKLFLRGG